MELVNVPFREDIKGQADRLAIGCHHRARDFRNDIGNFWPTVSTLIGVGKCSRFITGNLPRRRWVDRLGEDQLKAIRSGMHLQNLKRHFSSPIDPFKTKGLSPLRSPTSVRTPRKKLALIIHSSTDRSRF